MSVRRIHSGVSVDVDRFSDRKLQKDWLPLFASGALVFASGRNGVRSVDGIRQECREARQRGFDVFPSAACDNVLPNGSCGGHDVEDGG